MNKAQFLQKISSQFSGVKAEQLADIGEFLGTFSEDALSRLYSAFEEEYLLASPPRKGHLIKIARNAGIGPQRTDGPQARHEFVCYVCDSRFDLTKTTCPTCSNSDKAYRSIIRVGAKRTGMLKQEIEDTRNLVRTR